MTRMLLFVVFGALVVAGCTGETGPSEADIARGDVIAADPIFGDVPLDRPVRIETAVIHGDDPISPTNLLEVWKVWRSDGTTDLETVAQLVDVALDAGWIDVTIECDHLGAATVSAKKTFNDGADFPVSLVIHGPHERDPDGPNPGGMDMTAFATRPGYTQYQAIPEGTANVVDLGCLEPFIEH